jgi:hypothetical protein
MEPRSLPAAAPLSPFFLFPSPFSPSPLRLVTTERRPREAAGVGDGGGAAVKLLAGARARPGLSTPPLSSLATVPCQPRTRRDRAEAWSPGRLCLSARYTMKMAGGDMSPVRKTGRGPPSPAPDPFFDPRRVRVSLRVNFSSRFDLIG